MTAASARDMTVEQFLASLPPERRTTIEQARQLVLQHLPDGYQEAQHGNCLCYEVPLSVYPDTYNGHALWYAALGSGKNYCTLHLMGAYANPAVRTRIEADFRKAGKKLDMGKACLHFRSMEDLPAEAIGRAIGAIPMAAFVASAKAARTPAARAGRRAARARRAAPSTARRAPKR